MRRRWTIGGVVFVALIVILIVVAAGALSARPQAASSSRIATVPPSTCGAWGNATSANLGNQLNFLAGVAALPGGDAWAAGSYVDLSDNHLQTLIERNIGGAWSIIASPNSGTSSSALYGIAADSTSDAWAVGASMGATATQTLIERWDGTTWRVVPSPNGSTGDNVLNGVAAVAANNVWAVGYSGGSGGFGGVPGHALVEHYDGTGWAVVPNPGSALTNSTLQAVAASSASDVWAVGDSGGRASPTRILIEHYNGKSWSIVLAPNASPQSSFLFGVAADSSSDAWAVGYYETSSATHTLAEHWDGQYWSLSAMPDGAPSSDGLFSVTAISASDVWAVGQLDNSAGVTGGLTEHWNGATWSQVPSPNPGDAYNLLRGVAAVSANSVWAIGQQQSHTKPGQQTLVERYSVRVSSGTCPQQT
jgi:hypothetical protein